MKCVILVLLSLKLTWAIGTTPTIDFSNCDRQTFCYRNPPGCTASTCKYGATIQTDATQATIMLTTTDGGSVSLGFSTDENMGGDDVVGCYTTPDGSIVPTDSWNPNPIPNKKPKRPPTVGDNVNNLDMIRSMGMISNGALQCTVVRSLKTNDSIQDFDWTKPWYLFYATSTTTGTLSIPRHQTTPLASVMMINIANITTPLNPKNLGGITTTATPKSAATPLAVFKAYEILLMTAWLLY